MIYLDHNATTPIAPEVLEAMLPYFKEEWGNPSSSYRFGSKLKSVIEKAREQVADLLGAHPLEIIFTSCGTESNNTAIHAALRARPDKRHIVTSQVEHSAVLNHCKALEAEGYQVTYLPVDNEGLLNMHDLENAITPDTAIVSLIWANNETGVLFPVKEIAQLCKSRGVLLHCDGVQAVGKTTVNLKELPIDYLSLTGHKIKAPKGIGALFVRRKAPFTPYLFGGHQEANRRGGTENIPLIVGLGTACKLAEKITAKYSDIVKPLRDRLEERLLETIGGASLNGHLHSRIANTTNISFEGVQAESLLLLLDSSGVCASSGSACLADSDEPSHVISAMRGNHISANMVRFSLSAETKASEIDEAIRLCQKAIASLTN